MPPSGPTTAAQLAALADVFVSDGFGVVHRKQASVYDVARLLPAAVGGLVERADKTLADAREALAAAGLRFELDDRNENCGDDMTKTDSISGAWRTNSRTRCSCSTTASRAASTPR